MRGVGKMLRLEWMMFKLSAIADLQVPVNVLLQFFNDVIWYGLQICLFEALYLKVDMLDGWGVVEMRVFLGVLFTVDALQMIFFAQNFDFFSEKVRNGDLDLLLLKPVSSQHLMTSQRLMTGFVLNLILGLSWLIWSLTQLPGGFPWDRVWLLLIVIPAGLSVFYATRTMVVTCALLFTSAAHLSDIYFALFRMGTRPDRLYSPGFRYLILMVIPVGMIASVPTRMLVDPFDWWMLAGLLAVSGVGLLAANRFWHWALRRYSEQ